MSESSEPDAAPGWYADPDQAQTLRYWDGRRWTGQRALIEVSRPSSEKRERTRREGKCQICEKAVPLGEQYTVVNDLENGKVVKRKNAAKREDKSHYCGDCASRRVKEKQAWLDARTAEQTSSPSR